MFRRSFLTGIYDSANIQRWNDKIRPVELRELDKQAHKMVVAYVLSKYEENKGHDDFSWTKVVEGGIFEFFQRSVLTDLKPQLLHRIMKDASTYRELNNWVYERVEPMLEPIANGFVERFKAYLGASDDDVNRRILNAAHFYATKWEFDIIERADPEGFEIHDIKKQLEGEQEKYYDLEGIRQLALYRDIRNFTDLCGILRFQVRWSHLPMIPRTSVLGHMLIVGILSYLFTLEISDCERRRVNNFFTGLFHDLPEVLTRDVVNPVKSATKELGQIIEKYADDELRKRVYGLLPESWYNDFRMFAEDEFKDFITKKGQLKMLDEHSRITQDLDNDLYNPKDGSIVKAMDDLAAYMEACLAIQHGGHSYEFSEAKRRIKEKYMRESICGFNMRGIYSELD